MERPAQFLVVLRRPDPRKSALELVQRPGVMPALGQAAVAALGTHKLVLRALLNLVGSPGQQPQIVERADVFLCLDQQEVRIRAQRLGQQRLHVPRIGDDDIIGVELFHRPAVPHLDLAHIPVRRLKLDDRRRAQQLIGDAANSPARKPGEDVADLVPGAAKELGQSRGVHIAATRRGPVKEEADDRHLDTRA